MRKIILLLILSAINTVSDAQKIYVCLSHKPSGEAVGQLTTGYWHTKSGGNQMEILLDMGKRIKSQQEVYFIMEKLSDKGRYEPVSNSDVYRTEPGKNWLVWSKPEFESTGQYRIFAWIGGANAVIMAVAYLYVDMESSAWNPEKANDLPFTDYKDMIVSSGKSLDTIEGFIPEEEVGQFMKTEGQHAVVMAFVVRNNFYFMAMNSLQAKFYLEENGVFQLASTSDIYVMPLRDWAGFYSTFDKAGKYRLKLETLGQETLIEYDFVVKEF